MTSDSRPPHTSVELSCLGFTLRPPCCAHSLMHSLCNRTLSPPLPSPPLPSPSLPSPPPRPLITGLLLPSSLPWLTWPHAPLLPHLPPSWVKSWRPRRICCLPRTLPAWLACSTRCHQRPTNRCTQERGRRGGQGPGFRVQVHSGGGRRGGRVQRLGTQCHHHPTSRCSQEGSRFRVQGLGILCRHAIILPAGAHRRGQAGGGGCVRGSAT